MNALITNKEDTDNNEKEEEEDDRYITRPMCAELDQFIVEDFFVSYDISNCGSISFENFTSTLINMCSIRKKLITTLKVFLYQCLLVIWPYLLPFYIRLLSK